MKTRFAALALGLAITALIGCGPGEGTVTGTVSYNGKNLVYGTVTIIGSDGIAKTGEIASDGTYAVQGVRAGTAKVLVSSARPVNATARQGGNQGGRPKGRVPPEDLPKDAPKIDQPTEGAPAVDPEVIKKWFAIPESYGDPAKTTLSITVKSGSNTIPLELK